MARFNPIEGGTEPPEKPTKKPRAKAPATKKKESLTGGISGADFMAMLGGDRQKVCLPSQTESPPPSISLVVKTPNPLGVSKPDNIIPIMAAAITVPSAIEVLRAIQRERNLRVLPEPPEPPTTFSEYFGEPVYTYSRQQAIDDGVLVDGMAGDLDEISRQHFKYPIAMTATVFGLMQQAVEQQGCDYKGVWHDILWMAKKGVTIKLSESCVLFEVAICTEKEKPMIHTLKCHLGPGDKGEPVITIMLKNED